MVMEMVVGCQQDGHHDSRWLPTGQGDKEGEMVFKGTLESHWIKSVMAILKDRVTRKERSCDVLLTRYNHFFK